MTKPLAVAGGFFWITMNIIETVDNFLTEHKIILNKHVPFKVLQLHCEERQDIYGLFRKKSTLKKVLLKWFWEIKNKLFIGNSGCFVLGIYISLHYIYNYNLNNLDKM